MRRINQIREGYDILTEKDDNETRKLTSLIRAGLFDAKKLPMLKRALGKDPKDLTPAERKVLIELLDSLMSEVLGSPQIYQKVRQDVMKEDINEAAKSFDGYLSKYDPRYVESSKDEKQIPTIIILKRKAIRFYPDNQRVALYYSQALDKYVTIPFGTFDSGSATVKESKDDDDDKVIAGNAVFSRSNPKHAKIIAAMDAARNRDDKLNLIRKNPKTSVVNKNKGKTTAPNKNLDTQSKVKKPKGWDPEREVKTADDLARAKEYVSHSGADWWSKQGTKIGLTARNYLDRAAGAVVKHVSNATNRDMIDAKGKMVSESRSNARKIFMNKRQQQVNEVAPALALVAPYVGPALGAASAGVAGWLASKAMKNTPNVSAKTQPGSGQKFVPTDVPGAHLDDKKGVDRGTTDNKIEPVKFEPAPAATTTPTAAPPATPPATMDRVETPAANPAPPIPAAAPSAPAIPKPATQPDVAGVAPGVQTKPDITTQAQTQTRAQAQSKAQAQTQTQSKAQEKEKEKEKNPRRPRGFPLPSFDLPSIKKSKFDPEKFSLAAHLSSPKGEVRTGIEKRTETMYRKALQKEETNNQDVSKTGAFTTRRTPVQFKLQARTSGASANTEVRTGVSARDAMLYRRSLQNENMILKLKTIDENNHLTITMGDDSVIINNTMADKILNIYENVNRKNKQKIEKILSEDIDSIKKFISFAVRQ